MQAAQAAYAGGVGMAQGYGAEWEAGIQAAQAAHADGAGTVQGHGAALGDGT